MVVGGDEEEKRWRRGPDGQIREEKEAAMAAAGEPVGVEERCGRGDEGVGEKTSEGKGRITRVLYRQIQPKTTHIGIHTPSVSPLSKAKYTPAVFLHKSCKRHHETVGGHFSIIKEKKIEGAFHGRNFRVFGHFISQQTVSSLWLCQSVSLTESFSRSTTS